MLIAEDIHCFIWRDGRANNCNTYFFHGPPRVLVDPGHRRFLPNIQRQLQKLGHDLKDIDIVLGTHCHPDHIEGVTGFNSSLFAMHRKDWQLINEGYNSGGRQDFPVPDLFLRQGELVLGEQKWQVWHCPGHSPGSVCFYLPRSKVLISGDVVFKAGLGRVDLPGGQAEALKKSIFRLAKLQARYLLPGHGDLVIGRKQVAENFDYIKSAWFSYL